MGDKYNNRIAKTFAWFNKRWGDGHPFFAITLSPTCCRYSCSEEEVDKQPLWRKHEEVHKDQMGEIGKFKFWRQYLWELVTKGYRDISFEVEARKIAGK